MSFLQNTIQYFKQNKRNLIKGTTSLGIIIAVMLGGHQYVEANLSKSYHVVFNGKEIGVVSNPRVIEELKEKKKEQIQKDSPDVRMVLKDYDIQYTTERTFNSPVDDSVVLGKLDKLLVPQAMGLQLKIDGELFGVVKDEDTANAILEKYKSKYISSPKEANPVIVLTSAKSSNLVKEGEPIIKKVDFVQEVEWIDAPIEKEDLTPPEELLKKLETGDVQPTKYVVQPGDCLSCIAKKFNIPKQLIHEKNPWIYEDQITAGRTIDLTVLQPALSVKTIEQVVANQEIQHDVVYELDNSLKAGVTQEIKAGKNGMKKMTLQLTKINGMVEEEQVLGEEIVEPPISSVVKRGTKVVRGEGTGKFAWPVVGSSITSTFGMRWGKMHKGIDLVGNSAILAADNGRVVSVEYDNGYGNHIVIDHLNGYRTLYGHMSKMSVKPGQIVEKGEKLGTMGSTGNSTGTHLHFEIIRSGSVENPLKYLNR